MRASLIRHVDPWQEVGQGVGCGVRYEGDLCADRLPRLRAFGHLPAPLRVAVLFTRDAAQPGAVGIELTVDGTIETLCQRCLESLTIAVAVHNSVWVVRDDAAARALESSTEAIVSAPGDRLELAMLVEDEVLLAMPIAPRHSTRQCEVHPGARAATDQDAGEGAGQMSGEQAGVGGEQVLSGAGSLPASDGENRSGGNSDRRSDISDGAKRNPFAVLAGLRDSIENKD